MSLLVKSLKPGQICQYYKFLRTSRAGKSHWLPEYKPGPVPETKEEKIEAAKFYNLLPEEYECIPDKEEPVGNYPKLPVVSVEAKDPYYAWDHDELARDYNEPVFRQMITYLPEFLTTEKKKFPLHYQLLAFWTVSAFFFCLVIFIDKFKTCLPVCEKQCPTEGVTHYTFDLVEDEGLRSAQFFEAVNEVLSYFNIFKLVQKGFL